MSDEYEKTANNAGGDEVSLVDLLAVLLERKWLIFSVTLLVGLAAFAYQFIASILPPEVSYAPDVYSASSTLLIRRQIHGGLSYSEGATGLYGLIEATRSGESDMGRVAAALIVSGPVVDRINEEFGLVSAGADSPRLMRDKIRSMISVTLNGGDGTLTIEFSHRNRDLVAPVVERFVQILESDLFRIREEQLQSEIDAISRNLEIAEATGADSERFSGLEIRDVLSQQLEVAKIQMGIRTPIFLVLDPAETPLTADEPNRTGFVLVGGIGGFFLAVFLAFAANTVKAFRKDQESMEKLKAAWRGKSRGNRGT